MQWTPLLIGLTISYFLVASISTFDLRLTQAKRDGTLPPDEPTLPRWVVVFDWLMWAIFIALLYLNWKYALLLFAIKFVLKVLPILETIGNILMSPFRPRYFLALKMRKLINHAMEAVYSERFDIDTLVPEIANSQKSVDVLRAYVAIEVASDTKQRKERPFDEVLEELCSWEKNLREIDSETVLEPPKLRAMLSLIKTEYTFANSRASFERDPHCYEGLVYSAERAKKGPLTFEEMEQLRAQADQTAQT